MNAAPSDDAVVRTERLWLRHILPADAPVMYAMNADPEVLRYTGDEPFRDAGRPGPSSPPIRTTACMASGAGPWCARRTAPCSVGVA